MLAPDRLSECKCCQMFIFSCPTLWRPEQLAEIGGLQRKYVIVWLLRRIVHNWCEFRIGGLFFDLYPQLARGRPHT